MASRTFHFPGFSIVSGDIKADVSLNRFEKQFQEAQFWLDGPIWFRICHIEMGHM